MLRTIIIDDEKRGRSVLQQMLHKYCSGTVEIVAMAESADAGRKAIAECSPDLVFLDVEMPKESGLELLQSFGKIDFEVIFVTAHENYAIQAIKMSALDYLLKPVNLKELKDAVARAEEKIKAGKSPVAVESFLQTMKSAHSKIGLPTRIGVVFVQINDILRCESESNYTTIFLANGEKHTSAKTLKDFEQLLTEYNFIRIHQSHLVNALHIKQYLKGDGGTIILTDNSTVEVSRRHKEELMKRLLLV